MKRLLKVAMLALPLALFCPGCNENSRTLGTSKTTERKTTTTTTTETSNDADSMNADNVDPRSGGATAIGETADGRGRIDVDGEPGGGVHVNVQGQPIRERIRERRAARDANLPR